MINFPRTLALIALLAAALLFGCSSENGTDEHNHEGSEHHGPEGEESGTELALDQTLDNVRNGIHLILAYDADTNSFVGTAENTTKATLQNVRVEVHLSNGKELGPAQLGNVDPGEIENVKLVATSKDFDGWSAHSEFDTLEELEGKAQDEHDGEGGGEHK